jgi:hypothetical protein
MAAPSTNIEPVTGRRGATIVLYAGFGLFLLVIGLLVASSVGRRDVPTFVASPATRVRSADWQRTGDTITIDASDDARWRFVSFTRGTTLLAGDTSEWTIGIERYKVMVNGVAADAGAVPFELAKTPGGERFVGAESLGDSTNAALRHWYRYNFLTHLLEPNGHTYVIRDRLGGLWRVEVLSYYCPGPDAGCLTIRYAPLRS